MPTDYWIAVDLWRKCGEYHLPTAGAMEDQDAWLMDAFDILRATDTTIRAAREKEWRKTRGLD